LSGKIAFSITLLIFAYGWLFMVAWVNIDARKKGRNIRLSNSLFFSLGPVALFLYYHFPSIFYFNPQEKSPQNVKIKRFSFSKTINDDKQILKTIDKIFQDAIAYRATDIHLEPDKEKLTVRFRIDGFLYEYRNFPAELCKAIVSAIKVLSNLDIAQKRSFQDGSFSLAIKDRKIDIRVSVSASQYGETMVMRILDPQEGLVDIANLGILPESENQFRSLAFRNDGLVLIAGPTGCGKTTTLYAVLNKVNNLGKNIVSIEDPVEYKITNVTQIPINLRAGVTFANSLRSILRQDPDIIMVGEIRDIETAKIAIEASLTGHLVFSTLHIKDSVSTIMRFFEMGFERYLISSSISGVISQRLVRLLCPQCKIPYILPSDKSFSYQEDIKLKAGEQVYKAKGCNYCTNTGYRKRIGLFEILVIDKKIKELINNKASEEEILAQAKKQGMITLLEDGLTKIRQGLTSVEEIEGVLK
jgi:type IV pilus assembly protein PilB